MLTVHQNVTKNTRNVYPTVDNHENEQIIDLHWKEFSIIDCWTIVRVTPIVRMETRLELLDSDGGSD
jgi:hypothetical protein